MKLKFVEEQPKPIDVAALHEKMRQLENTTICRHCGAEDSIVGSYHTTSYGTCRVHRHNGRIEEDNHEDHDWEPPEVTQYQCVECDTEDRHLEDLILAAGEEFERTPEDDET